MNTYQTVSVIVALLLYVPLCWQILSGRVTQNLATFVLWGSLDLIAGLSILVQGGNYQLPLAYVLGCILVVLSILKSKNYGKWTGYETMLSILVLFCTIAWAVSGPWFATIFSTAGVVIAGLPQLRDSWREPEKSPLAIYLGYTFVNVMSTMGGKAWTVEERLYPGSMVVLCFIIVLITMRKYRETAREVGVWIGAGE